MKDDIKDLGYHFIELKQKNTDALSLLIERIIKREPDERIWSAAFDLLSHPTSQNTKSQNTQTDLFDVDLFRHWQGKYFPDSLDGLKQQMQHCVSNQSPYYAKTMVFVQSSGVGKSRLADTFGESCPMISFTLREENSGYPPPDTDILSLMRQSIPLECFTAIQNSPSKDASKDPEEYTKRRKAIIWNHSLAMGLLQASLDKCKFCAILIFAT